MKPWTLCLITSIMIAVIFTFLILFVIMREKIRELFSSCFGGRKDRIESKKMENFEVEEQPLKEEIYSTPKEREPPICVSVGEACVMPKELTLREKMEVIDEEFRLGRIERERVSRLNSEENQRIRHENDLLSQNLTLELVSRMNGGRPPSPTDSGSEACATPKVLTYEEKVKTLENENVMKKKKIDEDYKKAKKEIDEKYDPEIAQINQNLDRIHNELKECATAVFASIRVANARERGTSFSSSDSGGIE